VEGYKTLFKKNKENQVCKMTFSVSHRGVLLQEKKILYIIYSNNESGGDMFSDLPVLG
jgi:hypothetical protein